MTDKLSKNFHGVGIGPLSKILAVKSLTISNYIPWDQNSSGIELYLNFPKELSMYISKPNLTQNYINVSFVIVS